jgi:hypothetical protein
MSKYQVTIRFEMTDEFMQLVPEHRSFINDLIEKGVIDHYVVTMESQRVWITINATGKREVKKFFQNLLFKYWKMEIEELFVIDGQHYRLPAVQLN